MLKGRQRFFCDLRCGVIAFLSAIVYPVIVYTRTYTYTFVHSHVQKKTEGLGWRVCVMRTYGAATLGGVFFLWLLLLRV